MKKTLCLFLAFLLTLAVTVSLAACAPKDAPETETATVPESATETESHEESVTETETETETYPPVDGTDDPDDPRFSHYAVNGTYYANLEIFKNSKLTISFDISARKMNITDRSGKATVYSYDSNYFLTRIDTPSSLVITIDNTVSDGGLLLSQAIHYRYAGGAREYSITYTYDEDDRISGMVLVDSHLEETLNTEFVYCGNGSYLIRDLDSNKIKYYHLNYYLTADPMTSVKSEVLRNGDLELVYSIGPLINQKTVYTRTSGEICKMVNEYFLFYSMLDKLNFKN